MTGSFRGLAYTDAGAGLLVLLTHGVGFDSSVFGEQVAVLLALGCRVLTVDAPGHGGSAPAPEHWTHAAFADDLAALLTARQVDPAVIVGHSQGGWVGLHLALRHPARVRGLVLLAASADAYPPEAVAPLREAVAAWVVGTPLPGYAHSQALNNFGGSEGAAARWVARWAEEDPARYVAGYEALVTRPDLRPELGRITVPCLVVAAEHDPWIPAAEAAATAAQLPDASFEVIAGAWHTFMETHPAQTNRALTEFVTRRWPPAAGPAHPA